MIQQGAIYEGGFILPPLVVCEAWFAGNKAEQGVFLVTSPPNEIHRTHAVR